MALPLLLIFNAGRIISIAVRAGTALARFVAKNPKVIGTTYPSKRYHLPSFLTKPQKKKK